jgi:hypothetical protein
LIKRFYWKRDNARKKQPSRSFFKKYLWVLRDLCGERNSSPQGAKGAKKRIKLELLAFFEGP